MTFFPLIVTSKQQFLTINSVERKFLQITFSITHEHAKNYYRQQKFSSSM